MAQWGDWSGPSPSVDALRKAGFTGALRYIGDGSEGKQIHRAEADRYKANGFPYVLVTELHTTDAWEAGNDYAAGVARAERALADARAEGIPDSVPIAWAADAHAVPDLVRQALDYGRGFQSVLGARTGVYGFIEVVRAAKLAKLGAWYWLAGSKPSVADQAWINFWQHNDGTRTVSGTVIDINEVYAPMGAHILEDDVLTPDDGNTEWAYKNIYSGDVEQKPVADWIGENNSIARHVSEQVSDLSGALNAVAEKVSVGGVDVDAVAAKVVAQIKQQLAPLIDLANRLES